MLAFRGSMKYLNHWIKVRRILCEPEVIFTSSYSSKNTLALIIIKPLADYT